MTKIIELAHALGEEIAKSAEIDNLEVAKGAFESDTALQEKMREYETQRTLLGEEFAKADSADRQRIILKGDVPSPVNPPAGCRFAGRCPCATDVCLQKEPELREVEPNRFVACHLVDR